MKINSNLKYMLLCFVFIIFFSLMGCNNDIITDSENDDNIDTSTDTSTDTDIEEEQGYFVATVSESEFIIPSFYTDGKEVPENLKGIYYSADSPGGKPRNDGTGKIYLYLNQMVV